MFLRDSRMIAITDRDGNITEVEHGAEVEHEAGVAHADGKVVAGAHADGKVMA